MPPKTQIVEAADLLLFFPVNKTLGVALSLVRKLQIPPFMPAGHTTQLQKHRLKIGIPKAPE
jgi:hypothetical protein